MNHSPGEGGGRAYSFYTDGNPKFIEWVRVVKNGVGVVYMYSVGPASHTDALRVHRALEKE